MGQGVLTVQNALIEGGLFIVADGSQCSSFSYRYLNITASRARRKLFFQMRAKISKALDAIFPNKSTVKTAPVSYRIDQTAFGASTANAIAANLLDQVAAPYHWVLPSSNDNASTSRIHIKNKKPPGPEHRLRAVQPQLTHSRHFTDSGRLKVLKIVGRCAHSGRFVWHPRKVGLGFCASWSGLIFPANDCDRTPPHNAKNRPAKQKTAIRRFMCLILLSNFFGSPNWVRTSDLRINSPSLYRLSYRGSIKKMIIARNQIAMQALDCILSSFLRKCCI